MRFRLFAISLFALALGPWPAAADWTRVQLADGSQSCKDTTTGGLFPTGYTKASQANSASIVCSHLGAFINWLGTANGQPSRGNIPNTASNIPVPPNQTLSPPWSQADIGTPPVAGNAYDQANIMTVLGSGSQGHGSELDSGHWAYQALSGNKGIKFCLQQFTSDSVWVRGGVAVRGGSATNSTAPYMSATMDQRTGVTSPMRSIFRQTQGGLATNTTTFDVTLPGPGLPCLAVERNGSQVSTFYGYDINNVTTLATTQTITFPADPQYYGFYVSNELSAGNATVSGTVPIVYTVTGSAGTVQYVTSSQSVNENAGTTQLCVSRASGSTGTASVQVTNLGTGTAVAGTDFTDPPFPVTLNWADADSANKCVTLTVLVDSGSTSNQTLNLGLGSVSGATIGAPSTMTLTINNVAGDPVLTQGTTNFFIAPGQPCNNSYNGKYASFQSGSNGPWCDMAPARARSWVGSTDNLFVLAGSTITGSGAQFQSTTASGVLNGAGTGCTRRFLIGAYYISAGTAFEGLNGGNRPVLRGTAGWWDHQRNWQGGGTAGVTYPVVNTSTGSDGYDNMLGSSGTARLDCQRYENLDLHNWGGRGIYVRSGVGPQIYNVYIESMWREAIYCDICTAALFDTYYVTGYNFVYYITHVFSGTGVTCYACTGYTETNGVVWDGWGEAINNFTFGNVGSTQGLIQGNFVLEGEVGLYGEMRSTVVRQNVFARTGRAAYARSPRGPCIVHADEDQAFYNPAVPIFTGHLAIYANIIAGCGSGASFWSISSGTTNDTIYYYGNTIIGNCDLTVTGTSNISRDNVPWTNGRFWSNWVAQPQSGCVNIASGTTPAAANLSKNYWSSAPPASWQAAGDVTGGCTTVKTTGWNTLEDQSSSGADGHKTLAQALAVRDGVVAGARPSSAAACKGSGVAIASRTFPSEITFTSGPASTDYDGNAYSTADIGAFKQ